MIELLTVVAILAVVAAFAAPGFQAIFNSNRLSTVSNELSISLQAARTEAIRRRVRTVVCPSSDGASCNASATWGGFLTFEDTSGNGDLDTGERVLRSFVLTGPVQVIASDNIGDDDRIVFRHDGFAYNKGRDSLMTGNLRVCLPTDNPEQNSRLVSLAAGGRVAIQSEDTDSVCEAPDNP